MRIYICKSVGRTHEILYDQKKLRCFGCIEQYALYLALFLAQNGPPPKRPAYRQWLGAKQSPARHRRKQAVQENRHQARYILTKPGKGYLYLIFLVIFHFSFFISFTLSLIISLLQNMIPKCFACSVDIVMPIYHGCPSCKRWQLAYCEKCNVYSHCTNCAFTEEHERRSRERELRFAIFLRPAI